MDKYTTVYDYLKWRGDLTFDVIPFNRVDGLIFSELVYLDFFEKDYDGIINLQDCIKTYLEHNPIDEKLGLILPKQIKNLCSDLQDLPRFKDLNISDVISLYDEQLVEQYASCVIHLSDKEKVLCYRGTDDTLIGWQENFEMIIKYPIPSHTEAILNLNKALAKYPKASFHLVGHSKGGNLALYAMLNAKECEQKRIIDCYNYDGPGFEEHNINIDVYNQIKDKIYTIIPYQSVIGMIFKQLGNVYVVKSNFKGLWQHDALSWGILRDDFIYAKELKKNNLKFAKEFNEYISSIDTTRRVAFCKSLRNYIESTNSKTLLELSNDKKLKILPAARVFTKKDREIFNKLIKIFILNNIIQ